jgi:hypothetical protein
MTEHEIGRINSSTKDRTDDLNQLTTAGSDSAGRSIKLYEIHREKLILSSSDNTQKTGTATTQFERANGLAMHANRTSIGGLQPMFIVASANADQS